ncbi:pseudouridine-metabolizing bifunctional protein C1861.05-like [Elysia marginata]|uniref:Pseudouridine-metabolizing bifunctional protein C1861.05-like n=1 Tax=Elysia marginata TaxID=1093978 RepID=A0AAV4JWK2_9GAST|nr:pseudouridine-metabolizing bifunctional protein C1861.05-like [Elysia marginata]
MNGATYPGKVSQSFGGVGRNLADCLSRLGLNPVFVSAVGKNTNLKGCSHMDVSMVQCLDDQSTATYCPVLRQDGHLLFGVGDMDINTAFNTDAVEKLDEAIMSSPIVMLDGNFSATVIEKVVKKCALYTVPVWFEPTDQYKSKKPFETDAWKNLSIISPNIMELVNMHASLMDRLGSPAAENVSLVEEPTEISEVLRVCVGMCRDLVQHIPVVVVTLGHHGVLLCHNLGPNAQHLLQALNTTGSAASFHAVHYPLLRETTEIVSVSGAGDCLAASLLSAMLVGHPIDECVRLSLAAAELSLASHIAVPATITQDSLLGGRESSYKSPLWKPQVLGTTSF